MVVIAFAIRSRLGIAKGGIPSAGARCDSDLPGEREDQQGDESLTRKNQYRDRLAMLRAHFDVRLSTYGV